MNLVGNAIKFTEDGHVYINVSTERYHEKDYICFDVEDTGIGIPEDKQKSIFEAFRQADGSTTRRFGGTGLGLTITKQLTELLGGKISLESKSNVGTTFTILLPAGVDLQHNKQRRYNILDDLIEETSDESNEPQQTDSHPATILIAEDAPANQALIRILLERLGHKVTIVENGIEAIKALETEHYDLVLMDMMMPDMNGYDATKKLRAAGYELPIIALTANAMKGDDQKCNEAGCNEYISKPIDRKKLRKLLEQYLHAPNRQLES